MKVLMCLFFAAFVFAVGLSSDVYGQKRPYGINQRQQNQRQRIVGGIKSGELTARETYRLAREQYQIQRMETRFRRSGDGLSYREGVRLRRELNQASRHIYMQKHDGQDYPKP